MTPATTPRVAGSARAAARRAERARRAGERVSITPSQSQLGVILTAGPVVGTSQAQFSINYSNPGVGAAPNAIVRYALDNRISYVHRLGQ